MGDTDVRKIMAVACVGFGICLVCSPLSSAVEALVSLELLTAESGDWVDQAIFALFFIGVLCLLGHRSFSRLHLMTKAGPTILMLALIEAGVALMDVAVSQGDLRSSADLLMGAGAALRGVGVGVLLATWIELLSLLSPYMKYFGIALTSAFVLCGLVALILGALAYQAGGAVVIAALAVLPAIDVALLRWCLVRPGRARHDRRPAKSRIAMPVSTRIIIGASGASLGGMWVTVFAVPNAVVVLGANLGFLVASVALAVVTCTVARWRYYSFGMLLRVSTFASAASFLALPVLWPTAPAVVAFIMGCAWALQVYAYAFMPLQMIEKLPVDPFGVMAAGSVAFGAGIMVASITGGVLTMWLGTTVRSFAALTMVVVLLLLLAALLMPPSATDASVLGLRSCMERETPAEQLDRRCREVAAQYGLTEREGEVMLLLAQGLSRTRIAEELVVSNETVKTHAKHIYEKLGVHSLREMMTLVETGKRPEGESAGKGDNSRLTK